MPFKSQSWPSHPWLPLAFVNKLRELKDSLPVRADYEGAMAAIVRLQRLYRLQVPDIYSGNYLGYLGPPLGPTDAFEVGRQAFVDGYLAESISWLELAADKQRHEALSPQTLAHTLGLLGRAYFYVSKQTGGMWYRCWCESRSEGQISDGHMQAHTHVRKSRKRGKK